MVDLVMSPEEGWGLCGEGIARVCVHVHVCVRGPCGV